MTTIEPRPACTHCNGSGILAVSKDPDEIVDCVCTDPLEPLEDCKTGIVVAFADMVETVVGVELLPFQRAFMDQVMRDV